MIQVGKLFAERYNVLGVIGQGGMADVFLGEDTFLDNRKVAIKVLRGNMADDETARARFQREAFAMAELVHPNIVSISDVGEVGGQQFIVMEYIDGVTLKEYIKRYAPLSNQVVVNITEQILSGIAAAHAKGIIHRDLKPQNILVTRDGQAKITDFGIAKASSQASLTQTTSMYGSVHYMSPEQTRGNKATEQSDVYAIGIMLYEMLVGDVPFNGDTPVEIALKHFQNSVPSILAKNHQVPQALENVVIKATAKDTVNRYKSADDMLADLSTALDDSRVNEQKLVFPLTDDETKLLPRVPIKEATGILDTTPNTATVPPAVGLGATQVVEPVVQPAKVKKSKGWMFMLVAVLALIGIFAGLILTQPKEVEVPDVNNQALATAKSTIKNAGFKVGDVIDAVDKDVEPGRVVRTNPEAGMSRKEGSEIDIYVSSGGEIVTLEDYTGLTEDQARDEINDLGIDADAVVEIRTEKDEDVEAGHVIRQSPGEGAEYQVGSGDKITLTLSEGAETATMPKLADTEINAAIATLKTLGVPGDNITAVPQETLDKEKDGIVLGDGKGQTPSEGETIKVKTTQIVLYYYDFSEAAYESSSRSEEESISRSESEEEASKAAESESESISKSESISRSEAEKDEPVESTTSQPSSDNTDADATHRTTTDESGQAEE
jgi:serine/threonine-protein kinase